MPVDSVSFSLSIMKDIILFGMQGSGKGTQGKIIAEKYSYAIFETGAELRKLTKEDSPLGRKIKAIVDKGDLVPNEIVMEIIEQFLRAIAPGRAVLFDGLPRSMPQKMTLDALLQEMQRRFFGIFLEIPKSIAVERLLLRGRNDDNEKAIANRIENYQRETLPVIEEYESNGLLRRVNGLQEIDEVNEEVISLIEEFGK